MASDNQPDTSVLLEIYRRAALIKKNDEKIIAAARSGKMNLIYYSPRGQEIIPSALSVHLSDDDYVCTIYRGIHDQLAKGVPSKSIWAEYAGRVTGSCKGKGGPMHITYPAKGVMVTTGVVGSSMPIANGLALAAQIQGVQRIAVANFGDGASNIGAFLESLNLASVWQLPVIFVCQNNLYAEHSSFRKFTAGGSVAQRAEGLGMPGVTVDGNDAVAMWRVAREAVARARAGEGPTLIEAMTFRFQGHLLGDDASYIPAEQLRAAVEKDPVLALRSHLIAHHQVRELTLTGIEAAIEREVEEAQAFALSSKWPTPDELLTDVWAAPGPVKTHLSTSAPT
ncbi:MAG TPA: thiamine pyrophosphate-dependent dehydrogenase E1 component subunit alpha [Steroidobacteraceae bacterium]|nr:thiamine pyrophosphate-dependent dehydrogenase E1 component subunit alpha [Steroidobacteraceae bacterium]